MHYIQSMDRILITGGAGFVGSNLARQWKESHPKSKVVVLDNLRRRGSEINLQTFRDLDIEFVHGDIRNPSDLNDLNQNFDLLIEASAEPSVHAGTTGSPDYVLQTNLFGTANCLEFARQHIGHTVFLSTSRVYSIESMKNIELKDGESRFEIKSEQSQRGISKSGISEDFDTSLARSFYGSSKLASEMLVQEYVAAYGMKAIINRCGVIAGPGQFGKVDQGVFTLWVARHFFEGKLSYTGFGGKGFQVRDLLHPADLYDLLQKQIDSGKGFNASIYNVGGGTKVSTSLLEYTNICQKVTGKSIPIPGVESTASVDVPLYISDYSRANNEYSWAPQRSVEQIVTDIYNWIKANTEVLKPIFS